MLNQDFDINYLDKEFKVTVTYFMGATPARTNCLPEDSYPAEGPELEFEITKDQDDYEFLDAAMDNWDEFHDYIEESLYSQIDEQGEPDEPD